MEFNMKRCYHLMLVGWFAIISTDIIKPVQGQHVDTEPKNITALEGDSVNLLCRWGQPLQYCRIQVPGEKILILSELYDKIPGFKYYGAGLDKGQCGVTIGKVKGLNHGQVKCYLGSEGVEQEGEVNLTVALSPLLPEFEIQACSRTDICEVGDTLRATCISRDGRPAARLMWLLNNEPITNGLSMPETVESLASSNTTLYTVTQTYIRPIQASDDRKFLICETPHITDRGQQPQRVQYQLQVRYPPMPLPEIELYGLKLSHTALINVTIQANPRPRTEWIVDGIPIPEGTQNSRYESYEPVDLGNGLFNVTLAIASLTLEDTTKTLSLKASNEFGTQDYRIQISSNQEEAKVLDVGSIVGIVVGLAVLLIVIVLIIVARVAGLWCFAAKPLTTKNVPSETSDTESADVKTPKTKKFQLNLHQLFHKKTPKKPVDEETEAAVQNDPNDDAMPSEATVIVEDDEPPSPQKTEKNLVYAELVLKPSSEVENPHKNTTEYAEIVYVSKPEDNARDTDQPDRN